VIVVNSDLTFLYGNISNVGHPNLHYSTRERRRTSTNFNYNNNYSYRAATRI